jgi:hypothetical protein
MGGFCNQSENTGNVRACHQQTPVFTGKTEIPPEALQKPLQKPLQIDLAALLSAIGNLTAEQRAEVLKALGASR